MTVRLQPTSYTYRPSGGRALDIEEDTPTALRSTRKVVKIVVIFILGIMCFEGLQLESNLISTSRDLLKEIENQENGKGGNTIAGLRRNRPIMHTFYEPITGGGFDGVDSPMIKLWKEEWQRAGFDTKVLTLADAKKHPYFETMEKAVKEVFPNDLYNQYCFYRYLAMAAVGGGWSSDNDTFPTNFPIEEGITLPNGGKFSSHQMHVPALLSGSADEWSRVSKLMTEAIPRSKEMNKSDMMILRDLKIEGYHDIDFALFDVASPDRFWRSDPLAGGILVDCDRLRSSTRAIHMSHASLAGISEEGKYPIATKDPQRLSGLDRANGARAIMEQWRKEGKCGARTGRPTQVQ